MVNQEQEVLELELVENENVHTEPLSDTMFVVGSFNKSLLGGKDDVFEIDTIGNAHSTPGGSFVTPAGDTESFDLFKLQDEEAMDALDPTKGPPAGWEPGPEDDIDTEVITRTKWDDLQDGLGIVVADLESSLDDPVRMYLREIGRVPLLSAREHCLRRRLRPARLEVEFRAPRPTHSPATARPRAIRCGDRPRRSGARWLPARSAATAGPSRQ